jgi:hypothetical protein
MTQLIKFVILIVVSNWLPSSGSPKAPTPASRIGVTHWAGCYFLNASLPGLLDGAVSVGSTGTTAIKLAVFSAPDNYPFNSQWPAYNS